MKTIPINTTALILLFATSCPWLSSETFAETRGTITRHGITWTFAKPMQVGRFVTGDWWVVGPVTIAGVTPAPAADRHGSVVNPPVGDAQGYDARISGFDGSLRAKFPLELMPGESLVSTASVDTIGEKTADTVRGQYCRGPLRTAVVLTCLETAPAADAFRPAYVGTWKQSFTASQLRRDILPQLKAPEKVPDVRIYQRDLERIWLDHMRQWVNRNEEVDPDTWKTFGDARGNNGLKAEAYRKLNGPTWVGQALAARLTGMVGNWDHPAFFDYVDRWYEETENANMFVRAMWSMYRTSADNIGNETQRRWAEQ